MKSPHLNFFLKLFLFGLLLSAFPVMLIGLISYIKASDTVEANMSQAKQQSLLQNQTRVEQVLKTVDQSMSHLVRSSAVRAALQEPLTPDQFQLYRELRQDINFLFTFETGLQNFFLLSTGQDWIISSEGLFRLNQIRNVDEFLAHLDTPFHSIWVQEPYYATGNEFERPGTERCPHSFNLFKKLPLDTFPKTGLAAASIPVCYMEQLIAYEPGHESVLILDENNRVILQTNPDLLGGDGFEPASGQLLSAIAEEGGPAGQLSARINGQSFVATYRYSDYNNWTYLSLISTRALHKQARTIGWFTAWMSLLLLMATLAAAWIGSKRLYRPVGRLVQFAAGEGQDRDRGGDEFQRIHNRIHAILHQKSELEEQMQGQAGQLKSFFMMKLLQGGLGAQEVEEKLRELGYPEEWENLSVLTLQVDTLEGTRYRESDLDLLMFAINNMIEEMIPQSRRLTPILYEEAQVTVVLSHESSGEQLETELYEQARRIQETIRDYLQLSVSIGVSLPFRQLSDVPGGYREGLEAMRHRLRLGPESIIFFRDLPHGFALNLYYPARLHGELLEAVKLGDRSRAERLLGEFFEDLSGRQLGPKEYEMALMRLLIDLVNLTQSAGQEAMPFTEIKAQFDQLFRLRTAKEIQNWFRRSVMTPIIGAIEEQTRSQHHNISSRVKDIIHGEFDQELTLESIAARLHYNANYISNVFRKETGILFSEYLSGYRHSMARRWLLETDLSVREISERLRFNNPQNFIRSFRKLEGTTPGKFRETGGEAHAEDGRKDGGEAEEPERKS